MNEPPRPQRVETPLIDQTGTPIAPESVRRTENTAALAVAVAYTSVVVTVVGVVVAAGVHRGVAIYAGVSLAVVSVVVFVRPVRDRAVSIVRRLIPDLPSR